MSIYALGDLHLSFAREIIPGNWEEVEDYKPMDIFGKKWHQHYRKIYDSWNRLVSDEDTVLIPGDISWANELAEMEYDLNYITDLPGKKVMIRGNHDYWWQGISRLRAAMPEDIFLIQNDSISIDGITICGSRGWVPPNNVQFSEHDEKIFKRELIRLEMSLKSIKQEDQKIIVMLHFMPVNEKHEKNELIDLLIDYNVDHCIYGHLHGEEAHAKRVEGTKWGINFQLVSADYLKFKPKLIL